MVHRSVFVDQITDNESFGFWDFGKALAFYRFEIVRFNWLMNENTWSEKLCSFHDLAHRPIMLHTPAMTMSSVRLDVLRLAGLLISTFKSEITFWSSSKR